MLLHEGHGLGVQGFLFRTARPGSGGRGRLGVFREGRAPFGEIHLVLRRALASPVIGHGLPLVVGDERPVQALEFAAGGLEQHVALAEELLGPGRIEDGARVILVGDLKRNAAREVCLDEARHHVHARALRRHDEVDAGGTGELGKAHEAAFHILARREHEIRQFVNDDDEVGHGLEIGVLLRPFVAE